MISRKKRFYSRNRNKVRLWNNRLKDVPCFIIGNSPCLDNIASYKMEDFFTIGINRSFTRIVSDILMWQDIEFYFDKKCREQIFKLDSILYAKKGADPTGRSFSYDLLNGDYQITSNPTVLAGRGNTAPLAFQLAYLLGCSPIIFVGFDCCYRNGKTNFYGVNKDHKPHTLKNCIKGQKWISEVAEKMSINVIDCSNSEYMINSMDYEKVIDLYKPKEKVDYKSILLK